MHAVGLHSALAIKRQRKRREEQKRARERRYSSQSTESGMGESRSSCASPRNSIGSLDHRGSKRRRKQKAKQGMLETKVVSSVGMMHIGVMFIVLGLFLVGSGIIPDDYAAWNQMKFHWWNELIITGIFACCIGLFLIILHHFTAKQIEDDLAAYVERQLTRSKSGRRLVRDVETGGLTSKRDQKLRNTKEEDEDAFEQCNNILMAAHIENEVVPVQFSPTIRSPPPTSTPRSDLERILEEELSEKGEDDSFRGMDKFNRETMSNGSSVYTPGSETQELLTSRYISSIRT